MVLPPLVSIPGYGPAEVPPAPSHRTGSWSSYLSDATRPPAARHRHAAGGSALRRIGLRLGGLRLLLTWNLFLSGCCFLSPTHVVALKMSWGISIQITTDAQVTV